MFEAADRMGKTFRQHDDHGITEGLKGGVVDVMEKKLEILIRSWSADLKMKETGGYTFFLSIRV